MLCICAAIVVLTFVCVLTLTRKRVRGNTWFPEGFFTKTMEASKHARSRNGPEGEEKQ